MARRSLWPGVRRAVFRDDERTNINARREERSNLPRLLAMVSEVNADTRVKTRVN